MRLFFDCSLKELCAAALVSCVVAGGTVAFIGSSAADNAKTETMFVNRNLKGNRLPQATVQRQPLDNSLLSTTTTPARPPLGCDPAFSPIVDPELAHIYKRCMS